ncbi:MAG TPA: sulfatase [Planctomycetota bacterium]
MIRDAVRSVVALLAGASLLAMLDGLLELAFPGRGHTHELVVVALAGAWIVCGGLFLGMAAAAVGRRGRGAAAWPAAGTAFWCGVAVGAAPPAASLLARALPHGIGPVSPPLLGLLAAAGLLCAAPRLGARLRPGRLAPPIVAAGALLLVGSPFLATGLDGTAPAYRGRPDPRTAAPPGAPDVILVSVDTLRADAVFGPASAPTPNLDRLAAEGAWSDHALSSSNQTMPGHLGMLTGLDAMHHGLRSNLELPRSDQVLLAERFRAAGWATAGVVSNGLISAFSGFDRGYELYDDGLIAWAIVARAFRYAVDQRSWLGWLLGPKQLDTVLRRLQWRALRDRQAERAAGTLGEQVTDRALTHLQAMHASPRPAFLFVHFMDAHTPYLAPTQWRGRLTGALPELPGEWRPEPGVGITPERLEMLEDALRRGEPGAGDVAAWYHAYYLESVAWIDHCVGRLMDGVRASGRPTVLLVTSDHGEHFGEHGLLEHANSLYRENLEVPFVFWGLGVPAGVLAGPVHLEDVAPTLLALAGLPAADLDGRAATAGEFQRAHVAADARRISFASDGWKWIGEWSADGVEAVALFHTELDPGESENLIGKAEGPEALRLALRAALQRDAWVPDAAAPGAEQAAVLQELGYVDADGRQRGG